MGLYEDLKVQTNNEINTNGIQAITGEIHNLYLHDLIDEVGAAQVYGPIAIDYDPGDIQNPRAYITYPGIYTNFDSLEITAPLGILKWNGTAWSVTQLSIPSGYNYFKAKTTAALVAGTPYTSVAIEQMDGGWTDINPGQWIQIVDRRTGKFDIVQLTTALTLGTETTLNFASRIIQENLGIGSLVEVAPRLNMKWWTRKPVPLAPNAYFDLPTSWRLPPVECVDPLIYLELLDIEVDQITMVWNPALTEDFHYDLHPTNRWRVLLKNPTTNNQVLVKYWQPTDLSITA